MLQDNIFYRDISHSSSLQNSIFFTYLSVDKFTSSFYPKNVAYLESKLKIDVSKRSIPINNTQFNIE